MNITKQQWAIILVIILLGILSAPKKLFPSDHLNEFKVIAEQGCVYSQYNLGVIFYGGAEVLQDYQEAARWTRMAVQQRNEVSQRHLFMSCRKRPSVCR